MTIQHAAVAAALSLLLLALARFVRTEQHRRRLALPADDVDVPALPLACFTGRLDLLSDDELARRWDVSGVVVRGHGTPAVVASAALDRVTYLDELERRRVQPPNGR